MVLELEVQLRALTLPLHASIAFQRVLEDVGGCFPRGTKEVSRRSENR